ncbi:hypothetical protein ACVIQT_009427 [Bradyrhizobium diazoefficiens]
MRIKYLSAIVIAVLAAGAGLAINSIGSLPTEGQSELWLILGDAA